MEGILSPNYTFAFDYVYRTSVHVLKFLRLKQNFQASQIFLSCDGLLSGNSLNFNSEYRTTVYFHGIFNHFPAPSANSLV
jgi:hypothetical protein